MRYILLVWVGSCCVLGAPLVLRAEPVCHQSAAYFVVANELDGDDEETGTDFLVKFKPTASFACKYVRSKGGGSGDQERSSAIERHVRLNFNDFGLIKSTKTRCATRQ
jgi:hypothetical protein